MSPSRRAKQFSAFDALKGLREALAEKERIPEERRDLSVDAIDELNATLLSLQKGQTVTVVYYCSYQQRYLQLTGPVTRVDAYWRMLYVGNVGIEFGEIGELTANGQGTP